MPDPLKSISLFVSNDFATDQRMQRIVDAFVHKDWKVHVIATQKNKSLVFSPLGFKLSRLYIKPEKGPLFYAFMNVFFFFKALKSKSAYLLAVDVDTVLAVKLASYFTYKTMLWDCHEIFTEMPELYKKPIVKKVWSIIESMFAKNIKHVLTVTSGVADHLKSKLGLNATVIHNYPRFDQIEIDIKKRFELKTILFQGALNEGRCLIDLIKSLKFLPKEFKLILAGDGHMRPSLELLVKRKALGERVLFTGQLSPEDLRKKTNEAFVGISLLNKEHINSVVSLANKNLDYIMAGLPCITVNLPEYASINTKWNVAVLLDSVWSANIADAILNLSNDFDRYESMTSACVIARQTLNWEHELPKLYDFIDNIGIQIA